MGGGARRDASQCVHGHLLPTPAHSVTCIVFSNIVNKILRANVIDTSNLDSSKVVFGATVEVTDINNEKKFTYRIVGTDEADIEKNLISISAPLCKAMMNKKVDDVIEVNTPSGNKEYIINSIKFS